MPQHVKRRPQRGDGAGIRQRQVNGQRGILLPQGLAALRGTGTPPQQMPQPEVDPAHQQGNCSDLFQHALRNAVTGGNIIRGVRRDQNQNHHPDAEGDVLQLPRPRNGSRIKTPRRQGQNQRQQHHQGNILGHVQVNLKAALPHDRRQNERQQSANNAVKQQEGRQHELHAAAQQPHHHGSRRGRGHDAHEESGLRQVPVSENEAARAPRGQGDQQVGPYQEPVCALRLHPFEADAQERHKQHHDQHPLERPAIHVQAGHHVPRNKGRHNGKRADE